MSLSQEIIDRTLASPQGEQGYRVCETLLDAGFEVWFVGGCVRDMALGIVPKDIDIATNATPEAVVKFYNRADETASRLGSVVVPLEGELIEVTTFRKDHQLSDGRFPESVEFTTREQDAARRDITINALYFNPISSEVYDPFNGLRDLNEKLIRIIGDPETRLKHDALRLLRVVRFRALIDGQYHPDTFAALHSLSQDIQILSGERCSRELEKILLGPRPERAFEDLWETDIIEYLLPELHACKGVGQPSSAHAEGDVWNHTLQVISSFTDDHEADTRWAALLHDIGKPETFSIDDARIKFNEHASVGGKIAKELLDRLQFPAKRRDKICWIIEHHMMMSTFKEIDNTRKAHWYYHPWFIELLQVFWLDIAGTTPSNFDMYEDIISDYNHFLDANPRPKKPLLNGEEVMEILSLQPGEKVGEVLKKLHEAQQAGKVDSKTDAVAFLHQLQL